MTKRKLSLVGTAVLLMAAAMSAAEPLRVNGLRCEQLSDPLGLDVAVPRLSWQLSSDRPGTMQGAYRVLVASSPGKLARDEGDLWDSGKARSGRSVLVEYTGAPLKSGQACYWKVQTWDDKGTASAWSEPAIWTMGLLAPSDWKAQWIGTAPSPDDVDHPEPQPAPLLRKPFDVPKSVRRATATICGLGYYELYLNGAKVGDHVLDPPITTFDKRALYVTYDVTGQVKRGANAVGVMLGNSWLNATVEDVWGMHKAPWRTRPTAIVQLDLELDDGAHQLIVSDGSWKCSTGAITFDQTRVGEVYDARLEKPGWASSGHDDSKWEPVAVRRAPTRSLVAMKGHPSRVMATVKPVSVREAKPGVYVFDMGQNLAGWPRLTVTAPAGTRVHMKCGERIFDDGTVDTRDSAKHVRSKEVQCDTYICKGDGAETYEPRFTYHGFQYVEVEGLPGKPTPETIAAQVVHTSFESTGTFACSNEALSKIESATRWAYVGNFVGFPTDCPHREKNGWTGDAQLAVRLGLEHFDAAPDYAIWIQTLEDAMRADGKLPAIAPTAGWGMNRLDGPAWESAYLLVPWEIYQQTGDARALTDHYDGFKKWVAWYTSQLKEGVVEYGLGDWAPVKTKTPTAVTSTGYIYADLRIIAETARLLGKSDEAGEYDRRADEMRKAFNAKFFDAATGRYAGGTQTAQSCALYQNLAADEDRARVAENLVVAVHASNDHIDTGILGAKYLLRALSDTGHADLAWTVATQRTQPGWAWWIDQGATTLWERWNGAESRNHVMFGDISAWFIEYIAGIQPLEPGYARFSIHPHVLGDLTWATGIRDTPYGRITSKWTRVGDLVKLTVEVPPNTTAVVLLPTGRTEVGPGRHERQFQVKH